MNKVLKIIKKSLRWMAHNRLWSAAIICFIADGAAWIYFSIPVRLCPSDMEWPLGMNQLYIRTGTRDCITSLITFIAFILVIICLSKDIYEDDFRFKSNLVKESSKETINAVLDKLGKEMKEEEKEKIVIHIADRFNFK